MSMLSAVHAGRSMRSLTLGMLALARDKWQWSSSWSMPGASCGSNLTCRARDLGCDVGVLGCTCSAAPGPFPSDGAAAVPLKGSWRASCAPHLT